jgi:hypothetical protein
MCWKPSRDEPYPLKYMINQTPKKSNTESELLETGCENICLMTAFGKVDRLKKGAWGLRTALRKYGHGFQGITART